MDEDTVWKTLIEFFREEFDADPDAVAEWLAQSGQDADIFIAVLDRVHPRVCLSDD